MAPPNGILAGQVAAELARFLSLNPAVSRQALAKKLGVSRQSLHAYMSGRSCPRGPVLSSILGLGGVKLFLGGRQIDSSDFPTGSPLPVPLQGRLPFERPVALQSEDSGFRAEIKSTRNGELVLSVRICLPK